MTETVHVKQAGAWGIAPDGSATNCFRISNDILAFEVISYGARLTELVTADRAGTRANVVLGYGALEPYLVDKAYLGCSVGRYANRIAKGRFVLEGQPYQLDVNDGPNTLHGGTGSLAHRNWEARTLPNGVEFRIVSSNGDQGFPGTLTVVARYRLEGNRITLEYEAECDQVTVVNLTNHAYFNLAGEGSATVLDHLVQLEADQYLPIDPTAIPLGELATVEGTPFDFRQPRSLGEHIHDAAEQLRNASGYDHTFVLRQNEHGLRLAATAVHPATGRRLRIETTEPGVQLYSGNYLDGTTIGRSGEPYPWRSALCLETQHWPDSPNQPLYPSTVLQPGQTLHSTTVWTFDTVA